MGTVRRTVLLLGVVGLLVNLVACGGSSPTATAHPTSGSASSSRMSPPAPTSSAPPIALRGPRIVVVMEENHSADQVIDSPDAPQLARLVADGTLLTQFFSTVHPSLPNYIALLSGDTHGIVRDCGDCSIDAPTLVDQLESAHLSWRAYMQGLPAPCSAKTQTAGDYAKKHDPFLYFPAISANPQLCADVVPFDQFATDLRTGQLPQFVWITPDMAHDMHGGTSDGPATGATSGGGAAVDAQNISAADAFLGQLYDELRSSSAWQQDTRLVVTWDEGGGAQSGAHTCCGGDAVGGHVATVVVGPRVAHGTDGAVYDHYALLRSIETALGLTYLAHAADASSHDIPALVTP